MARPGLCSHAYSVARWCLLVVCAVLFACQDSCPSPGSCGEGHPSGGTISPTFLLRVQIGPSALPYCALLPPSVVASVYSDPPGIRCGMAGSACEASFVQGTKVTLRNELKPGARLTGWVGPCDGDSKGSSCVLLAPRPITQVTANVALTASLDVSVHNPGGGGYVQVSPAGEGGVWDSGSARCGGSGFSRCCSIFPIGTKVRLEAVYGPLVSYRGMSGACETSGPACNLVIKDNVRVRIDMPQQ